MTMTMTMTITMTFLQMLLEEREGLSGSLDLNSKSILELQRKHREQEAAIRSVLGYKR